MALVNSDSLVSAQKKTVAVIIPVYNGENFIRRALDSVLSQTHLPSEIVVVDDESTDRTGEIVTSEYGSAVRLVRQKNGGCGKARNTGIRTTSAEFLAFLDADDWWDPTKLEKQLAAMADPKVVLNYTALRVVDGETGEHRDLAPPPLQVLERRLRWMNKDMPPSCVMVRKTAFDQVGGFNEKLVACEDWCMWFSLGSIGRFSVCEEPLTYYRQSSGGLSGNATFMFSEFTKMLDDVLLKDLSGVRRMIWRRRILSAQAFMSVKTARGAGNRAEEMRFMKKSLLEWPSPFWAPERFKTFAVTLLQSLRRPAANEGQ